MSLQCCLQHPANAAVPTTFTGSSTFILNTTYMETDEVSPTEDGWTYAHRRLFARQIESMLRPTSIDLPNSPLGSACVGVVTLRVAWVAMLKTLHLLSTQPLSLRLLNTKSTPARSEAEQLCVCFGFFPSGRQGAMLSRYLPSPITHKISTPPHSPKPQTPGGLFTHPQKILKNFFLH